MTGNRFGTLFSVTTFGESHGPAIGAVVDGCPSGLVLPESVIQTELDRRRPGQSDVTTPRKEADKINILSGVFEGKTTGAPIGLLIYNTNQQSKDYSHLKHVFRPGHADYTYTKKYKHRDYRGGGRSSGRETAARVAAGAIAKHWLAQQSISIQAYTMQVGSIKAQKIVPGCSETNSVRCPDPDQATTMIDLINHMKNTGDSIGGLVQLVITGLPVGIGEPCFNKLDAVLGHAILSIGTIKGIEFGVGFDTVGLAGSESNDAIQATQDGTIVMQSNHAGGITGGISTGEPIVINAAVKAPSSIQKQQDTVTDQHNNTTLQVTGRHDPCLCPRIVPVIESMAAITLIDYILIHRAYSGE